MAPANDKRLSVAGWYPPKGAQDKKRLRTIGTEERQYAEFCLEFLASILDRRPEQPDALKLAAHYLTLLGYYSDGLAVDRVIADLCPGDYLVMYNLACSYSLNAMLDESFATLAAAIGLGYDDIKHMTEDPDLANMQGDSRFSALIDKAIAAEAARHARKD
ncbi:MAG: hypothetical protein LBJ46_09115 [Planctomycetota bacterium]|nr:hypothetical protein [Planctomycetota bacterium]